ncbi:hypothetical protein RGF97_30965 [Streptomyces roseicoloratus]|uniref:Ankyrin n=1 Tax=Streptomyces roseicoloratus TaxID=2508722 RepID=A0ABY9S2T3_9ACTN|nr:hypothetical protein [Streptomyces roseicoloratus]WMX48334.1 hypothetical protein RGF97_30965 [Streptomyces roseicoloratus]
MHETAAALADARWPLAPPAEAGWLRELTADDGITGFMSPALPDAAWLLHSLYEHEVGPTDMSFDAYARAVRAGGGKDVIPGIDPAEVLDAPTGEHPGPRWRRLRWAELADRLGDPTVPEGRYPCHSSFPSIRPGTWPAGLRAPSEGHMDRPDWNRLVDLLAAHGPHGAETACLAYWSPLLQGADFDDPHLRAGVLADAKVLFDHPEEEKWTPSNLWARDLSWVVCTDYDLWATKVSGPRALVEALLADPEIEAVRVPWAA